MCERTFLIVARLRSSCYPIGSSPILSRKSRSAEPSKSKRCIGSLESVPSFRTMNPKKRPRDELTKDSELPSVVKAVLAIQVVRQTTSAPRRADDAPVLLITWQSVHKQKPVRTVTAPPREPEPPRATV